MPESSDNDSPSYQRERLTHLRMLSLWTPAMNHPTDAAAPHREESVRPLDRRRFTGAISVCSAVNHGADASFFRNSTLLYG